MSSAENQTPSGLERVAAMETAILGRICAAADDLQRTEDLEEEQLAEIHAILQALKHDSESHAATVRLLAKGLPAYLGDLPGRRAGRSGEQTPPVLDPAELATLRSTSRRAAKDGSGGSGRIDGGSRDA